MDVGASDEEEAVEDDSPAATCCCASPSVGACIFAICVRVAVRCGNQHVIMTYFGCA